MNIAMVDEQSKILIDMNHRVFQIHRFADGEVEHVTRLLGWGEFPRAAKVIDMGCGTGEVARIMQSLRSDLQFTLTNISKFQIGCADPSMMAHCCDFHQVPEQDEKFDVVMFCFSIGHGDHQKLFEESNRLLKSGGVLFIYDMVPKSGNSFDIPNCEYRIYSSESIVNFAENSGFNLDITMMPVDNSGYAKKLFGSEVDSVFGETKPAIWRFIKC
jgi:ubiquinone/menaquinone biosynthesis C-methylase UbiE